MDESAAGNASSTIVAYPGNMGIQPSDVEKAKQALGRRHPLLGAYLDAMSRLDGPRFPIVVRTTQRRTLMQLVEHHRLGRRPSQHLNISSGFGRCRLTPTPE
jgi:hypothetical protein